jgi:hypothetical protein
MYFVSFAGVSMSYVIGPLGFTFRHLTFPLDELDFYLKIFSRVHIMRPATRVSFETSYDSKQPKLEPKLVLALSETKRLFRLFHYYIETASFGVSIEPKQIEDQPKPGSESRDRDKLRNMLPFMCFPVIEVTI